MPIKSLSLLLYTFISCLSVPAQNTPPKGASTKYVYVSIRPGISFDHMRVKGYFKEPVKFNSPDNLCIAASLDVDYDGEVIFRTEVTYTPVRFHTEGGRSEANTFYTYDLTGFSVIPQFLLFLKKSLSSDLNIYGGAGFGYRLSKILKNEVTFAGAPPRGAAHSLTIESGDGVVSCAIGLIYRTRYEFNCKLSVTQWGISSMNKLTNRTVNMGLCYRL
jgi:hypothetical protein